MTGDRLLRRLAPVILALYLACGVAPRAIVFAHHHHGDDHEHVHVWGADAVADDDHDHDHHGPDEHLRIDDGQVAFESDAHRRHADHVHTQSPYPVATHTAVAAAFVAWQAVPFVPRHALRPPARREVPSSARGPPRSLV